MSKKTPTPNNSSPKSKGEKIVTLLKRGGGATIAQLAKATSWQRHSVHGFMSGTLKKKRGITISSTKEANKDRRYFIAEKSQ